MTHVVVDDLVGDSWHLPIWKELLCEEELSHIAIEAALSGRELALGSKLHVPHSGIILNDRHVTSVYRLSELLVPQVESEEGLIGGKGPP